MVYTTWTRRLVPEKGHWLGSLERRGFKTPKLGSFLEWSRAAKCCRVEMWKRWTAEYSEIRWWFFCLKKKTFVARSCARNIIPGRAGVQKSWNLRPGWWASVSKPRMQLLNHARCHEWTDRTEARWGWTRYPFAWLGTKWPTLTNWMKDVWSLVIEMF